MRIRTLIVAAILTLVESIPATAQVSSAEVYVNVSAGVSASDIDVPLDSKSFQDGPRTTDIFLQSGIVPWGLDAVAGDGAGHSDGLATYLATTTTQISTTGDFRFSASAGGQAAALAGFDAVVSLQFQVAEHTMFSVVGSVSSERDLDGPEVVACQFNQTLLAGDTRATPLPAGTYAFDEVREVYPLETAVLECAAASSGGQSDSNRLKWNVEITDLTHVPEPAGAAPMLGAVAALAILVRRRRQPGRP